MITADESVDAAAAAMRAGPAHSLTKPINAEALLAALERALEPRRFRASAGMLRERLAERRGLENIVGSSAPLQRVFETVRQVAPARASVLITGESGTGKELIASALHELRGCLVNKGRCTIVAHERPQTSPWAWPTAQARA